MKIFSLILLVGLGVEFVLIRNYNRIIGKAWARILATGFIVAFCLSVLFPALTTNLAHAVGVGRGADLIFYLTTMGVILLAGATLLKFRSLERNQVRLIREIALRDFRELIHEKGLGETQGRGSERLSDAG